MLEDNTPKIIHNDEYLDLRKYPENASGTKSFIGNNPNLRKDHPKTRAPNIKCEGLRYEKELINCGLKKLANTFSAKAHISQRSGSPVGKKKVYHRESSNFDKRFRRTIAEEEKDCLKSQSELSIYPVKLEGDNNCNSTPIIREKMGQSEREKAKQDEIKHKATMTMEDNHERMAKSHNKCEHSCSRSKSKSYKQNHITKQFIDPRLCEKYSILKMPWKRTWTLPVFTPKSSSIGNTNCGDNFDCQTYLYDDGTEIDSAYLEAKHKSFVSTIFQNQCMALLFLGGSLCGILLVSLFIWLMFGNNFLSIFFKPREMNENILKQYSKYIGGGIIHIITNFFRTLGRVLAIPAQQVYRPQPENYRWTGNPT